MQTEDEAWTDYRRRFADVYDEANYGSSVQGRVMQAGHRLAERPFDAGLNFEHVLEVGAGTGEHLPFVRHGFERYVLTDVDEKSLKVARRKLVGRHEGKLSFELQADGRLTYADNSFDRLVATHVLEHIYQPHLALKEWRRVLKNGAVMSILIPTDPGLAWRLGRHLGPRRKATQQGIAYDYVMAREHVNSCNNLIALLRHYFPGMREAWWPLPVPSMDLNLFFAAHAIMTK
jgi:ubiquinone/menaquinone biosynthesis C-methylase UbiE